MLKVAHIDSQEQKKRKDTEAADFAQKVREDMERNDRLRFEKRKAKLKHAN